MIAWALAIANISPLFDGVTSTFDLGKGVRVDARATAFLKRAKRGEEPFFSVGLKDDGGVTALVETFSTAFPDEIQASLKCQISRTGKVEMCSALAVQPSDDRYDKLMVRTALGLQVSGMTKKLSYNVESITIGLRVLNEHGQRGGMKPCVPDFCIAEGPSSLPPVR